MHDVWPHVRRRPRRCDHRADRADAARRAGGSGAAGGGLVAGDRGRPDPSLSRPDHVAKVGRRAQGDARGSRLAAGRTLVAAGRGRRARPVLRGGRSGRPRALDRGSAPIGRSRRRWAGSPAGTGFAAWLAPPRERRGRGWHALRAARLRSDGVARRGELLGGGRARRRQVRDHHALPAQPQREARGRRGVRRTGDRRCRHRLSAAAVVAGQTAGSCARGGCSSGRSGCSAGFASGRGCGAAGGTCTGRSSRDTAARAGRSRGGRSGRRGEGRARRPSQPRVGAAGKTQDVRAAGRRGGSPDGERPAGARAEAARRSAGDAAERCRRAERRGVPLPRSPEAAGSDLDVQARARLLAGVPTGDLRSGRSLSSAGPDRPRRRELSQVHLGGARRTRRARRSPAAQGDGEPAAEEARSGARSRSREDRRASSSRAQ